MIVLVSNTLVFAGTRAQMEQFWNEHSHKATVVEMMLDSEAEKLGQKEVPEIISLLPEVENKDVLELGAGIG